MNEIQNEIANSIYTIPESCDYLQREFAIRLRPISFRYHIEHGNITGFHKTKKPVWFTTRDELIRFAKWLAVNNARCAQDVKWENFKIAK